MNISKDSWYHKVYRWWLEEKYTEIFGGSDTEVDVKSRTDEYLQAVFGTLNLCLFVKVILLYAPVRYLIKVSHIKYLGKPLNVLFNSGFMKKLDTKIYDTISKWHTKISGTKHWRLHKWLLTNLAIYVIILWEIINPEFRFVMFVLFYYVIFIGIVMLVMLGSATLREFIKKRRGGSENTKGFYKEVFKPYMKARKAKVCPMITFKEEK